MSPAGRTPAFRVAAVQTRPVFGDVEGNVRRALALASRVRADLYVFPELMTSGYVFVDRKEALALAETPGARGARAPGLSLLEAWARGRGVHAIAGFPERDGRLVYNSAALIGPRGVKDVYRKIHLFFEEKLWFVPGNRPPRLTRIGPARVGMLICYDWRFPELMRVLALAGADLVAHPSNLVFQEAQQAMLVRALENRLWLVTANRVGEDVRPGRRMAFTGRSQIAGPDGRPAAPLGPRARPAVLAARVDLAAARDKRITARNDLLADRRPEMYRPLARLRPPQAPVSRRK